MHTWPSGPSGPLPPSASLHTRVRARLADGGYGSGWPWPASGTTDVARALWQKYLSFSHRDFAASRLRVSPLPRPARPPAPLHERLSGNPARPDNGGEPGRPCPLAAATSSSRDPSGARARPCGCAALLPVTCKDRQSRGPPWISLCVLCAFVPLWFGPQLLDIIVR
jgi:hypothetical protein